MPKPNCIIIHGCPSSAESIMNLADRTFDKHWIPWLREQLTQRGIKTDTPLMPTPWQPVYREWKREIEELPVTENMILIGHSCAAAFLTKWLGETNRAVKKLIFVGGANISKKNDHRKDDLYSGDIFPDIKNNVKDVILFISNDNPRHIKSTNIYAKELNGRIIKLKNRGHFTFRDMGTNEFPELLAEVLS